MIIRAAYDHPAKRGKADLTNIVVWLTPLPASGNTRVESVSSELPHHFEMMQAHKRFVPHLLVVPVGSVVDFPNKDPFFHNVFSLFDGKRFDLGLYEAGGSRAIKFDRVGVSFLFCNIHPQMSGVVLTIATPYYGTSNDAGLVEIENVPAGKYRLEIWTERALPETLRKLEREITVAADSDFQDSFVISASKDIFEGHKNKYGGDYQTTGPSTPGYQTSE